MNEQQEEYGELGLQLINLQDYIKELEAPDGEVAQAKAVIAKLKQTKETEASLRARLAQRILDDDDTESFVVQGVKFTAALSPGSLEVDIAGVPDDLVSEKEIPASVQRVPNIDAIKGKLKDGEALNYARFVNRKPSLTMKGTREKDNVKAPLPAFDDL